MKTIKSILCVVCIACSLNSTAQTPTFVTADSKENVFILAEASIAIPLLVDTADYAGVLRASRNLREDIGKVIGTQPLYCCNEIPKLKSVVLIGTVGHSTYIDQLISSRKLDATQLKGKREKFVIETIDNPLPGIDQAVVIAGSDKRGTIYGIYELSTQIGVSPWYYWADVPVKKQCNLYIKSGTYTAGEPKVKYRGIFLNDEAPALSGWSRKEFGGFNHLFYEKVFELILRLKGNYLWPAMWGSAFYDDDAANGSLANEMGIVIGTSHHEPMARAHSEWKRYGSGKWDYTSNPKALTKFWQEGIERTKEWETLITVGMRGDGDEPMSEDANIALLENIIEDQRQIIAQTTRKKAADTPQVWALYKEVQEYYDRGMRVPQDITLLLCDDNWGNVRKLPELHAKPRKGGYGMYYHFDYVGGPRNYKWLNVSQVQRIWEQMNLTYQYGVNELWIVNVGDLKPMEYPIQFFLDMAWNPDRFNETNLLQHTEKFCTTQFGKEYAKEAARLINLYTKYNRRVTPELLTESTYSLHNYKEFETVVGDYKALLLDAMKLNYLLPHEYRDAYDQLVLFPIHACANLYEMYYAVAMNRDFAAKKDVQANYWAEKAKQHYDHDSLLTIHYNTVIAGGKWKHMMDQTHIGYTNWQQPNQNVMPTVTLVPENRMAAPSPVFVEKDGYVSIEAQHHSRAVNGGNVSWITIPELGKTLGGVTTTPVTKMPDATMYLEYEVNMATIGKVEVVVFVSPTLNFNGNRGLRYAVSFDGEAEQVVNINGVYDHKQMERWQATSINQTVTTHQIATAGKHLLRLRPLEPGIVWQKIQLNMGGLKPSYLGAPETRQAKTVQNN